MATLLEITTQIESVLNTLYPAVPRRVRKKQPGPAGKPGSSYTAADVGTAGLFDLITEAVDPVDGAGADFEYVSRTYLVRIVYIARVVPGAPAVDENPAVRAVRTALVTAFDVPYLTGVANTLVMRFDDGKPYEEVVGNDLASASVQTITVMTRQARAVGVP